MSLEAQYLTMMAMTASGAIMGAIYDMYRVVLKEWRLTRLLGPLLDFLFWIVSLVLVFGSLLWANHGDMRMYVFVILCIGYFLYKWTLQRLVVASTMTIIRFIQFTFRTLYKCSIIFIVKPILALLHMLLVLLRTISKVGYGLERIILWPFQLVFNVLRWMLRPFGGLVKKNFQKPYHFLEGFLRRLSNWLQNKD